MGGAGIGLIVALQLFAVSSMDECAPPPGDAWTQQHLMCLYTIGMRNDALPDARIRLERLGGGRADQPWPTLVLALSVVAEDEGRALALYDNRAAELAEWDVEQLQRDKTAGLELRPFFTAEEELALLASRAQTGHTDPDAVPAPHATSIVVGEYAEIKNDYLGVPVITYLYPSESKVGASSVAKLPAMVKFFSEKLGVKYPYVKYSQTMAEGFGGKIACSRSSTWPASSGARCCSSAARSWTTSRPPSASATSASRARSGAATRYRSSRSPRRPVRCRAGSSSRASRCT